MSVAREEQWFGQPRGLTVLFLTEMWEKFSYFGMRALLVYYMTTQLLMPQQRASFVYGCYTAIVYLTPIAGGVISDRWLGRRSSVVLGGSIMAAGHLMMTFEPLFYPALAAIALGNGLYLPSLPSQIGSLYAPGDARRSSSYSVYYVGVNLGAFLAPLICGTLGELYGWHWGFGAAGVGMVAGLSIYVAGRKYLPRDEPRSAGAHHDSSWWPKQDGRTVVFLLFAVAIAVLVFRGAYEQVGNTVALWAQTSVDRTISSGFSIPMTWFQSLNPLFIFLFGPLLIARWVRLARTGRESTPVTKMSIGAATVAAAYFMLAVVSAWTDASGQHAQWLWLLAFFLVLTLGELYILPVGLALFGRLAPPAFLATTIAAWFLAAFAGNLFAGFVGAFWGQLPHALFFAALGILASLASALLLLLTPTFRRAERFVAVSPADA